MVGVDGFGANGFVVVVGHAIRIGPCSAVRIISSQTNGHDVPFRVDQ